MDKILNSLKVHTKHIIPLVGYGLLALALFGLGFAAGSSRQRALESAEQSSMQLHYTLNPAKSQTAGEPPETPKITTKTDTRCTIKGNINDKGKKIYHLATGAFYATVKPEQCFATEEEAKNAGFTRSSR